MKPVAFQLASRVIILAGLLLLLPLRAQQPAATRTDKAPEDDKIILTAQQIELAKKQIAWRHSVIKNRGKFRTTREFSTEVNKPLIEGNKHDYDINRGQFDKAKQKADELRIGGDTRKAELMDKVAALYRQAAVINYNIVAAYLDPSAKTMSIAEAMDEIRKIEKEFEGLTSHSMQRNWLTNDEFEAYMKKTNYAREKQEKQGRRGAVAEGRQ